MGVSLGAFRTTIKFDGNREIDVEQSSASLLLGYQLSTRSSLSFSVGGIIGGEVRDNTFVGDVGAGVSGSASYNYLALFENESRPFISTSVSLSFSRTSAVSDDGQRHPWLGSDLRLGAMVGKTFGDRFVPFGAARVFAGPVSWKLGGDDVIGSDIYKYTLGGGVLYQIPGVLSVFAEGMAVGERSVSLGGTLAF